MFINATLRFRADGCGFVPLENNDFMNDQAHGRSLYHGVMNDVMNDLHSDDY